MKPVINGTYRVRLGPWKTFRAQCKSVNSIRKTALMNCDGIYLEFQFDDIMPLDEEVTQRIDITDHPDRCPKCQVIGEVDRMCCICRQCNLIIWGC